MFVFDGGIDVFAFHGAADSFFGSLMKSFAWTPTEISSFEFRGDDVDFFPCILAHVGDVKEVSIPAAAPRVAEPVSKDFGVLSVDERVIAGDGVAFFARDIDAKDFPEKVAEVLRIVAGVIGGSSVTSADVEVACLLYTSPSPRDS